ncbi:MAG: hypothetical protein K2K64_05630 [Muribaculaceae bacterium]|nr:hypothetical protein [Muribaculaceae bacterium]
MKKLLLSLVGLFAVFGLNAATVYFDNSGTGWEQVYGYNWTPAEAVCPELSTVDIDGHTLYVLETDQQKVIFRSSDSAWGDDKQTSDLKVVDGAVYGKGSLKSNGGSTDPIANIVDGVYQEYVVTPSAYPEMYLVGAMTGWGKDSDYKMETTNGVTYTLTCTVEKGKEFKFFGGSWGTRELTGGSNLKNGTYELSAGSANMTLAIGGTVTFTLVQKNNFTSAMLTITGQEEGEEPEIPEIPDDPTIPEMYLVGAPNGWSANPEYKMESTDGITYTLTCNIEAEEEFKFFGGSWGTRELTGAGLDLVDGTYELKRGSDNMSLAKGGTITFTLVQENNFASAKLTIEGQGEVEQDPYTAVYLISDRNGFIESSKFKMETTDGLKYTLNIPDAGSDIAFKFRVKAANGDLTFSNGQQNIHNGEYTITGNDAKNMTLHTGGNVNFTLEPVNNFTGGIKVTIEGQDHDADPYPAIYLVGDMTNWQAEENFRLSTTDGETYTITVSNMSGDDNFKFLGGDAHNYYFSCGKQNMPDGEYELNTNGNTGDMSLDEGGDVTFTFVLGELHSTAKLTVAGQGEVVEPEFPEMWLTSERYNWGARDKLKMQTEDGITYTLTVPDMSTQPFKFFGGDWGVRELTGAGNALPNGEYTLRPGSDNMTLGIGGNVTFTLVQENDFASAKLTIEGQQGEVVRNISYALHGQFESETWETIPMTAVADQEGVYTATFTPTFADGQFGVQMNVNGNQEDWYNEDVVFNAENPSHTLTLEAETAEGVNCTFGFPANVKYTATFNANTLELSFKADGDSPIVDPVEEKYYLVGSFGWTPDEAYRFTKGENNEYTLDLEGEFTSVFKINNGTWEVQFGSNGSNVVLGEEYECSNDGNSRNLSFGENKGVMNPHFVLNPETNILVVTGELLDLTPSYVISGSIFGDPNWSTEDLTEVNGKWILNETKVEAGEFIIIKVQGADKTPVEWIKADGEETVTVTLGQAMPAISEGANWSIENDGTYAFTFDPAAMTLDVTGEADDPIIDPVEETKYYLIGGFNNWALKDAEYAFTKGADGIYTLDIAGEFTSTFKINDGTWAVQFGSNGLDVVLGEEYECSNVGTSDNNISFGDNKGVMNPHFVLNPETNILVVTGELIDLTPSYVISGSIFGDPNWSNEEMTEVDGKWTLTDKMIEAGEFIIIKMLGKDKTPVEWIKAVASSEGDAEPVKVGEVMPTIAEGVNWSIKDFGSICFTFDPEANTLLLNWTTGIGGIDAEDGEAIYFNLQGQRVAHPDKGIYIRVVNGKSQKVVK